jgi:hypothetical protein
MSLRPATAEAKCGNLLTPETSPQIKWRKLLFILRCHQCTQMVSTEDDEHLNGRIVLGLVAKLFFPINQ